MNWLTKVILANWNYLLGGLVLLMVFICGVQIGESRINREWSAEKIKAALVVAKQEQRVEDIRQSQIQINQEISNDFQEKKKLLVGLRSAIRTCNVGVRHESLLNLYAIHILPTANQHVFCPIRNGEIAVSVNLSHVACVKPAAADGLCSGIGSVPIPRHDDGAPNQHLTGLPRTEVRAVVAEYGDFNRWHRATNGCRPLGGFRTAQHRGYRR
jgi:hypothetical protein